ncbi:MAG: hypothetical protein JST75_00415 [Bacteroidetes bacterium]|nr:hypothetical protein [Bacteroidota bacterium]
MKRIIFAILILTTIASCSHKKTILVYSSGEIKLDDSKKNITVSEGTTHQENEIEFSTSGPVTLNVQTPTGKYTLEAPDDGLYIANLKNDTVVGSYQRVGSTSNSKITQEQLKAQLDSLQQLIVGKNISVANKNYFIPPGKISKINTTGTTKIFGPYTSIPASFDAGSVSEIYKFYTNKEVREIIDKLVPMTIYKPENK